MRTGHVLWRPAAFMLSQALASTDLCARARVLELGAGVALAAAVACRRNARAVIATDGAATVLDLASLNLTHNSAAGVECHVAVLKWGDAADTAAVQALLKDRCSHIDAAFADRCDLVIGSDCFFPRPLDPDLTILLQGRAMFGTAAQLMRPCCCSYAGSSSPAVAATTSSSPAASESSACVAAAGTSADRGSQHSSGLLLTTIQVRRRGMNRELRAAAAAVGLSICFVDRECILQTAAPCTDASAAAGEEAVSAGAGAAAEPADAATSLTAPAGPASSDSADTSSVHFDAADPMLGYVRIALLAPCAAALEARLAALGWRPGDPAEDEDDMPPPAHETLAGGLFPDLDDD